MCIRDRVKAEQYFELSADFAQRAGTQLLEATSLELQAQTCLLYTSDAADERSSVDLGGRRIIKKKNNLQPRRSVQ